jgi:hypothetical protein
MVKKIKIKPSKIFHMAIFPLIAVFSVGFILFLRPFDRKDGKIEEEEPTNSKD